MSIEPHLERFAANKDGGWAWANFLPAVRNLIQDSGYKSVLEVGGGRFPSFTHEEIDAMGVRYTSNDISARELSLAPSWVGKACFDIQTPDKTALDGHEGAYDFAFSKMVMEHVPSYERAYGNLARLLKDGGMAIAFHPVLFSVPFVVNKLLPETISDRILRTMFPNRTDDGIPKFPAYYSGCQISPRLRDKIRSLGFSDVWQVPFYGHGYYNKIPGARGVHSAVTKMVKENDFTPLASYCFTIAVK